ncbi:monovalent cation/H+ antiporter complex subunit F [Actinomadura montaniterrae]|uniref:Cation:proton antiporter n=1 Tax=Actinomadura montaniterrae TaxID=1803903 RepID=A0A6L3VJ48_9ACTN|nr:monovalent cation/H+ antiporter complex subunit F [Actinomadura montaniterrae]KAB2370680.1 cation:proton antiporter [Actinomadura montaniterrae]
MTVVLDAVTAMLFLAAACTLVRIVRGPSMLDRAMALDVLLAVIMAGLGASAVAGGDTWVLPTLLALSLVAFVGSVAVARFLTHHVPRPDEPEQGADA